MKNPMTPDEMTQAIDDNAAGYDMQRKIIGSAAPWLDRHPDWVGDPLDFSTQEYRRKPELLERFVKITTSGEQYSYMNYQKAKEFGPDSSECRMVHLVEDPDWVEPAPAPTPMNPWRKIVIGEWPECGTGSQIVLRWKNMDTRKQCAEDVMWYTTGAIEWKYAEDE